MPRLALLVAIALTTTLSPPAPRALAAEPAPTTANDSRNDPTDSVHLPPLDPSDKAAHDARAKLDDCALYALAIRDGGTSGLPKAPQAAVAAAREVTAMARRQCDEGHVYACGVLAIRLSQGAWLVGGEVDKEDAVAQVRKAVEAGVVACRDGRAMSCGHAVYLAQSLGVGADVVEKQAYAACAGGSALGCRVLSEVARGSDDARVSALADPIVRRAAALAKRDCEAGYIDGCVVWRDLIDAGHVKGLVSQVATLECAHGYGAGCARARGDGTFDASSGWNRDQLETHRQLVRALKSACTR